LGINTSLAKGEMMNMVKYLLIGATLCWLQAAQVSAQNNNEGRLDEQYGLLIHSPNADWTLHQPDEFDVRAWLKSKADPVQMRLRALENFEGRSDSDFIARFKEWEWQPKRSFENIRRSGPINGRLWHHMTGKSKGSWFSMHLHFDRENVWMLSLEAPTQDLIQKYADAPRALIERLEFDAVPIKRLSQFDVLEVEIVPVGKGEWGRHFDYFKEGLFKSLTKKSGFKEVRAEPTSARERIALMTIRVLTYKYTYHPSHAPSNEYFYMGHTIVAELTITDKETGKTLSQHQMVTRPESNTYGGSAVDHILKLIIAKRKQ
jgi:hypothetical protein